MTVMLGDRFEGLQPGIFILIVSKMDGYRSSGGLLVWIELYFLKYNDFSDGFSL
jgi:hypothetical protein